MITAAKWLRDYRFTNGAYPSREDLLQERKRLERELDQIMATIEVIDQISESPPISEIHPESRTVLSVVRKSYTGAG